MRGGFTYMELMVASALGTVLVALLLVLTFTVSKASG